MLLSAVGAALVVLGTVAGAATGTAYGYGHESPHHFQEPVHALPKCPPVTEVLDFTQTDVAYVQETVTATSINYWPVDLLVTSVVFETATSYLQELVTVTPLPTFETVFVSVTTPVFRGVEEYYLHTVVETTSTWRTVSHLQYVTPRVVTKYLPLTETLTTTVSSSFISTYFHRTSLWVTEYSTVTTTTHVYATTIGFSTSFSTYVPTTVVSVPVYATTTSVVAISTVPVFVTASCVPVQPVQQPQYKAKASKESVHEKVLRMKEYLRNKFAAASNKGLHSFDVHIDKLKRKLEQSESFSTSKVSTSFADEPALRKIHTVHPLDASRLGPGKAARPIASGSSAKGTGFLSLFADLFSKGSDTGGIKGTAGLGGGNPFTAKGAGGLGSSKGESSDLDGDLGDLKSFAGALLQGFKTSAVEQLGRGKRATASLYGKTTASSGAPYHSEYGSDAVTSGTGFKSHYPGGAGATYP